MASASARDFVSKSVMFVVTMSEMIKVFSAVLPAIMPVLLEPEVVGFNVVDVSVVSGALMVLLLVLLNPAVVVVVVVVDGELNAAIMPHES